MPRLLELFCGTKSVGRAFEALGWEVVSVDIIPSFNPTIVADIGTWDPSIFPVGHFAAIHASPPCTEYSAARTTAKRPRDLEGSDSLVQKTMQIMEYLKPLVWIMENPWTGLLRKRPFMEPLEPRMRVISYCKYNLPYRKHTSIWTNLGAFWVHRPKCCAADPCDKIVDGRHPATAQQGPSRHKDKSVKANDTFTQRQLYAFPPELCDELALATNDALAQYNKHGYW